MRTVNPERHAAKRKLILEAAALVFAQRGYDGATTAAICREAGIGSGTLFHYFPNKRSLMLGLFGDDVTADAVFIDELDRDDPGSALWRAVDRMAADLASPLAPGMLASVIQLAMKDEEFALLVEKGDQRMRELLADLIRAGQSEGTFGADLNPERAARWIHGIITAGYFMTDVDGFEATADRDELGRILARYLGVPGHSGGGDSR
jgi:AcrR family transcriptional regulator